MNAEVQRKARRDEKASLKEQCKEMEENNRVKKSRDLLKKIRGTNERFHAKMFTIKNIKCMDLTEAETIKKRGQKYTEELHKMFLMTQITNML